MKSITINALCLVLAVSLSSCQGDKKAVNISEMGDTSFVNSNFKGNLINYSEGMSACDQIGEADLAEIYGVSADLIVIDDPLTNPDRQVTSTPICSFYIKSDESDFLWLRGSMAVTREIGKDEFMGEVHEATGGGKNWEEAWALKKSMSQSAEWIPNTGLAALWNESNTQLEIKFKGYTLEVYPLKNISNKEEVAKNRDYKSVALEMAKAAGYIQ
ncbi:MAG: hypothetical protein AAGH46_10740 [Bacteroidota bacterium]